MKLTKTTQIIERTETVGPIITVEETRLEDIETRMRVDEWKLNSITRGAGGVVKTYRLMEVK